jgi:hypothetical protein
MVEDPIITNTPSPSVPKDKTTIPVRKSTRDELKSMGKKDESYDKLLHRMMDKLKEKPGE